MNADQVKKLKALNFADLVLSAAEDTYGSGEYYWPEEVKQLVNSLGGREKIEQDSDALRKSIKTMDFETLDDHKDSIGEGALRHHMIHTLMDKGWYKR